MYPAPTPPASRIRFAFWWLLAQIAEAAFAIRTTVTGSPPSAQATPARDLGSSGAVAMPSHDPIYSAVPDAFTDHSPLTTGQLSLKPLALAGLAAYIVGIAFVLVIRSHVS